MAIPPKSEPTLDNGDTSTGTGNPADGKSMVSPAIMKPAIMTPAIMTPAPALTLKPDPVASTLAAAAALSAAASSGDAPRLDQVSRIEDKTARIEEKFARSEERMMRVESALEKATIRLEGATQDMNLQGVRDDLARLRDEVGKKPGTATIFVIALVAALLGAAASFAVMRFGIPGLP